MDILPESERTGILNLVSKAKKRRKERQAQRLEPVPGPRPEPVPGPAPGPVSRPKPAPSGPQPCWHQWSRKDVVAMDVEKVEIPNQLPGESFPRRVYQN